MTRETHGRALLVFVLSGLLLATTSAFGQEGPDSIRVSIHELESSLHRWDVIQTDSAVPAFQRGKDLARQGRLHEAALEMRKGLAKRRAIAQFNLGVLDFEQARYGAAYIHFRTAYRLKRDPVYRDYMMNASRLRTTIEGRK